MDIKNGFLMAFLILGALFTFYGNYVGTQLIMYFGIALIIAVGSVFGVNVQTQVSDLETSVNAILAMASQKKEEK